MPEGGRSAAAEAVRLGAHDALVRPFARPLAAISPASLREAKRRHEAELLVQELALHDGNVSRVARDLGISRPTLYKLLRKHGLKRSVPAPPRG